MLYNNNGDTMDELFKDIIIGDKELKELDDNHSNMNRRVRNLNDIAKYFLKTARRKYRDGKIEKKDIKKIIMIYNDLINENRTVKKYINSKDSNEELLKEAEHIMKLFVDDYVKGKEEAGSIWTREIRVAGFVEPLLLALIATGIGIIFLGNLYLYLY